MRRVGCAVLLIASACAPGDPVGQFDAMKPSSLEVDLVAGDTLRFRVDTEIVSNTDRPTRETVAALQRSQLEVKVNDGQGFATARCPLKGNGTMQAKSGLKVTEKGLIVACEVPVKQTGKHQVSATVAWDSSIKPLSALVEVRRVKK
jgi:hypothetical protein